MGIVLVIPAAPAGPPIPRSYQQDAYLAASSAALAFLPISVLEGDVLSFYVATLAQSQPDLRAD
jgi:hypothetical protein